MSPSLTCDRLAAWTLAAVLLQILGLSLFMFAFFPMRPALSGVSGPESYVMPTCDSADFPEEKNLPPPELRSLYNEMSQLPPAFDRLILMVVDGLPAEFILGRTDTPSMNSMIDAMPYTQTLLASGRALAFHAIAAAPTVTMPRLKAIVSGGIGGFLDVAFNFNTQAMLDDNLIDQFYHCGFKMVMLGDETWIRLFPGRFTRQDGVSSFYVKDTVEVDSNVSRHLETELAANDWNLLVLHYLGLDHVGHIGGRNSVLMAPKLKEMDDVMMMIDMLAVMQENDVDKRTLLMVVSDHGMTDRGNHGGSSYEEIDCLALFVGLQVKPADSKMVTYRTVNQVDIAPTLALLFGFPIPKNNVGVVIREVLDQMTDEQRLRALELNSWQLLRLLQAHLPSLLCHNSCNNSLNDSPDSGISKSIGSITENLCYHFSKAATLHNSWKFSKALKLRSQNTDPINITVEAYYGFLHAASEWLSHAATNKPVIMMLTGISILAFSCVVLLVLLFTLFKDHQQQSPSQMKILGCGWNIDDSFVLLGVFIHISSLVSSSLVEEEQYTWHFLTSTLYLIFLLKRVQSLGVQDSKMSKVMGKENHDLQQPSRRSAMTIPTIIDRMLFICKDMHNGFSICSVLMVLICVRVLRSWHQGGVNWTHLPDISKLLEEGDMYSIKLFHITSLVFLISLSCLTLYFATPRKGYVSILILSQCISTFLIFLHVLDSQSPMLTTLSYNLHSFSLFYGSLIVTLLIALASPWFLASCHRTRSCETKRQVNILSTDILVESLFHDIRGSTYIIGVTYITSWCLLQLLLQQPVNAAPVLLLFLQIVASMIYFSSEESNHSPLVELAALYFMGMTGHFGLGNNNTLAAIDVAGAFKGTFSQSTTLAGIMMFIITYASPLLHLLSIILWISLKEVKHLLGQEALSLSCILQKMLGFPCLLFLGLNSVTLTAFTITLLIMRDHLFIWSVFSPKYLYVCAATVCVNIGLLLVVATIFYICVIIFYGRRNIHFYIINSGSNISAGKKLLQ